MTKQTSLIRLDGHGFSDIAIATTAQGSAVLGGAALREIVQERLAQVEQMGFTLEHDRGRHPRDLAEAARSTIRLSIDCLSSAEGEIEARAIAVKAAATAWALVDRIGPAPQDGVKLAVVGAEEEPDAGPCPRDSQAPATPPREVGLRPVRACSLCGCTEHAACVTDNGPCGWSPNFPRGIPVCTRCEPGANSFLHAMSMRSGGTCADGPDLAERALQMIEATGCGSFEAIETIRRLVDKAGGGAARVWLALSSESGIPSL